MRAGRGGAVLRRHRPLCAYGRRRVRGVVAGGAGHDAFFPTPGAAAATTSATTGASTRTTAEGRAGAAGPAEAACAGTTTTTAREEAGVSVSVNTCGYFWGWVRTGRGKGGGSGGVLMCPVRTMFTVFIVKRDAGDERESRATRRYVLTCRCACCTSQVNSWLKCVCVGFVGLV